MSINVDKQTGRLYIQFNFKGATYKQRLPEGMTKTKAKEIETRWKHDLFFEANGLEAKKEALFERFLADVYLPYCEANHTKGNFERSVDICKKALPFFKGKSLRKIKPADIEAFKTHLENLPTPRKAKKKPATLMREMSIISKVFSLAVKNDYCEYNPVSRVEMPKFDNVQNKVLSFEDEERFFAAFELDVNHSPKGLVTNKESCWARDVCRFVLNTGLRQNDVLALSKFNVDLNNNLIRLMQGKTKRIVEIPLNETARAIIAARWHNGSDLIFPSPRTGKVGTSVKKACYGASRKAGIVPAITIKDLRRTFATRLEDLRYDATVTAKLLGHGDLRSVMRYRRSNAAGREAVEALENQNSTKSLPTKKATVLPLAVSR